MRPFQYIAVIFFAVFMTALPQAGAQDINEYVKQSAPPDWVLVRSVPTEETTLLRDESKFYRLSDWQERVSKTNHEKYRHTAIELMTSEGVQGYSNFDISFDPEFQTVALHSLHLIRGGETLDRLELSDFNIYRRETDREKLIYDGILEISLILPDVRVGDILEYSYTLSGKNKAFGPHYSVGATLKRSVSFQQRQEKFLIHEDLPVNFKTYNDPIAPIKTQSGAYNVYTWQLDDVEGIDIDDNRPAWIYSYPAYAFSSFKDWESVGEYFAPLYESNSGTDKAIEDVAQAIGATMKTDKAKARAALDYIHENIRYTGIEIGSGGYIPRPATTTYRRKFGDCKDMTVLLLALLRAMDIEAYPILVDSDYRGNIDQLIPSYWAFDHVLVRAEIDGKAFLLDGTRGKQLGDLDRLEQGNYGKGLLLKPGNARLVSLDSKSPKYYKDIRDTFDLLSDPETVTMNSLSVYYGGQADGMSSTLTNEGIKQLEENFPKFYQNTYADIEQIGEMKATAFPDEAKFSVEVNYSLGKGWIDQADGDGKTFEAYPSDVNYDVPDFKGGKRTLPYALSHPVKSRQVLTYELDDTWSIGDDVVTIDNPGFTFSKTDKMQDGTYTQEFIYISKKDHIDAEAYPEFMAAIKSFDDELGTELTDHSNSDSDEGLASIIGNLFLLLSIALAAGAVKIFKKPNA